MKPCLYIVIPCYNEEKVLPITNGLFADKLDALIRSEKISADSKILFVNDGSKDSTWSIIEELCQKNNRFSGLKLSRNVGHQHALLAGLFTAAKSADATISIDCDGQDDINAMDEMVDKFLDGNDIVYGVRSKRETDTFFKRVSAEGFYKLLNALGAEVVFNHADYRLMSKRAISALADFREVNVFLRGLIPLVGFASDIVYYDRQERIAGESHYPLKKMLSLAFDGISSLSVKPIHLVTSLGLTVSALSFLGLLWILTVTVLGKTVPGWASMTGILCLLGGIQLFGIGIIGEYIGKIYLETKARPRFIVEKSVNLQ